MPRLGSLASKAAPARPPSSDPCVARRQYAACASMQVRHSRRSAAARHARERARACTSAWKSTSRRPSTSASARPCRARHAASPSPSRRTAVSDSSSVHSATTVQMEPPIQPYSEAFCHLRPRMGRQAWLPCQGLVTLTRGKAAPRHAPPAPPRPGAARADTPAQPRSTAACRRRWGAHERRRRTACCPTRSACGLCACGAPSGFPAQSHNSMPPAPPSAACSMQRAEASRPQVARVSAEADRRTAAATTRRPAGCTPRARAAHPLRA